MPKPLMSVYSLSFYSCGTAVLKDVSLDLYPGEVHALLGENGAGKSTLIKIMAGQYRQDSGSIEIDGRETGFRSPGDAYAAGIVTLHQESSIFEQLSIAENLLVGRCSSSKPSPPIDRREMRERAQSMLDSLGFKLDASMPAGECSMTQRRMVEIARLAVESPRVLLLDEPFAGISREEIASILGLIERLRSSGCAILYVTHRFTEVDKIAARATIMRDGQVIKQIDKMLSGSAQPDVDRMVWGEFHSSRYPKLKARRGREVLRVERLSAEPALHGVGFQLRAGEILGIAGRADSGRTALAKALFGLLPASVGSIFVDGKPERIRSPADALGLGISYMTDDRYDGGLFMNLGVLDNASALEPRYHRSVFSDRKQRAKMVEAHKRGVVLRLEDPSSKLYALSGGAQQKVMLLRAFASSARILILCEPTRGVDIASRVDIYNMMNDVVRKGGAIILFDSSFEELAGMSDRIMVLRDGVMVYSADRDSREGFSKVYDFALSAPS